MNYITNDKKLNKGLKLFGVTVFWLLVWQVVAMAVSNTLLLPTVFETAGALFALVKEASFYFDVAWTILRCVLSISISVGLGILLAFIAYKNKLLRSVMTLPVSFFKAVPVMAIVIYVILLVESDWVAVVACFLMCFPVVYTNVLAGLDAVSKELLEVATVYRFSEAHKRKYIYLPSILPNINAAMKIVAGLSWKAVVAAEVLSVPEFSLGQGMINAKYYLETPTLFAYIAVIVALSLCLEKVIIKLTEKFSQRRYEGSKFDWAKEYEVGLLKAPAIDIIGISKSFEGKEVLRDITLSVDAGSKVAFAGPSGIGKTTLARIIAELEKPDSGDLMFSEDIKISYLFQEDRMLPWLNVYDNLTVSMISSGASPNNDSIVEMAKNLEIEDVLWSLPEELSGGMKHRVALGRTLLAHCNLLILDEPFRGLDEELKKRIVERLWDSCTDNKTVIVITHNQEDLELLEIEKSLSIHVE